MEGFGIHSSIWTMRWTAEAAEYAVAQAVHHGFDFVEVAIPEPGVVDRAHSRALFERTGMRAVCSLGLPEACWPSRSPEAGVHFLKEAIDTAAEMGAEALTGVIYGGIGERTGKPPTECELDNVARCLGAPPLCQGRASFWGSMTAETHLQTLLAGAGDDRKGGGRELVHPP
jgi:D-psicose/D-tagatose/L-ribulose 3-epimerase